MLDIIYGEATDAGRVWPRNADSAAVFVPQSRQQVRSRGWMFAVADGRGGNDLGRIASARAVERMVEGFGSVAEGVSLASLMPRLVQDANAAVHDEALGPGRRGRLLSTTIVSCALRNDTAVISHVGDSRCYLIREHKATLLTQERTLAIHTHQAAERMPAETEQSEKLSSSRSLGPEMFIAVETASFPLHPGDVLVLCTDGLYEAMYAEDIARIASQAKAPDEIARELVAYAVQADGADNATAQVIRIQAIEAAARPRAAAAS